MKIKNNWSNFQVKSEKILPNRKNFTQDLFTLRSKDRIRLAMIIHEYSTLFYGGCYASNRELATALYGVDSGNKTRQIRRHIDALVKSGILKKRSVKRRPRNKKISTLLFKNKKTFTDCKSGRVLRLNPDYLAPQKSVAPPVKKVSSPPVVTKLNAYRGEDTFFHVYFSSKVFDSEAYGAIISFLDAPKFYEKNLIYYKGIGYRGNSITISTNTFYTIRGIVKGGDKLMANISNVKTKTIMKNEIDFQVILKGDFKKFDTPKLREVWTYWEECRREVTGADYKPRGRAQKLREALRWASEFSNTPIDYLEYCIRYAVERGWQGVFNVGLQDWAQKSEEVLQFRKDIQERKDLKRRVREREVGKLIDHVAVTEALDRLGERFYEMEEADRVRYIAQVRKEPQVRVEAEKMFDKQYRLAV